MNLPLVKSAAASGGDVLLSALTDFKLPKALKDIAIESFATPHSLVRLTHKVKITHQPS